MQHLSKTAETDDGDARTANAHRQTPPGRRYPSTKTSWGATCPAPPPSSKGYRAAITTRSQLYGVALAIPSPI